MAGVVALIALVATEIRDGVRLNWRCAVAAPHVVRGFVHGLQYRDPVRPEVSRFDRMNYWKFAPPWRLSRPPGALLHALPREIIRQRVSGGREPEQPRGQTTTTRVASMSTQMSRPSSRSSHRA